MRRHDSQATQTAAGEAAYPALVRERVEKATSKSRAVQAANRDPPYAGWTWRCGEVRLGRPADGAGPSSAWNQDDRVAKHRDVGRILMRRHDSQSTQTAAGEAAYPALVRERVEKATSESRAVQAADQDPPYAGFSISRCARHLTRAST
jgi:Tfp pilus assembly protein PilW